MNGNPNYIPLILAALLILGLGVLIWRGDKKVRGIAGFVLLYTTIRILESSLPGNGVNAFIRNVFQGLASALRAFQSPNGIAELIIAGLVLGVLIFVMVKGGPGLRMVAGFILIYAALRTIEVILFGDGFNEFMRSVYQALADSFSQIAAQQP